MATSVDQHLGEERTITPPLSCLLRVGEHAEVIPFLLPMEGLFGKNGVELRSVVLVCFLYALLLMEWNSERVYVGTLCKGGDVSRAIFLLALLPTVFIAEPPHL